jgi:hypothetical protein
MVDYPRLPHVESGSDSEDGSASRQNGRALEVKSKRRYESEKESGEDSDKEIDELSRLLGDFGGKSDKNSSKDSGKKSDRESGKKSEKDSGKKSHRESGKESEKDSGKKSDKESSKKSDKGSGKTSDRDSGKKSNKESGKKFGKDSSKENGQESDNDEESGEDESSAEHTKATRYTKEQREEVTRVRKCSKKDYYAILGLEGNCSGIEVKKAYKKLSLLTHPDKNKYKDAEKAFKS